MRFGQDVLQRAVEQRLAVLCNKREEQLLRKHGQVQRDYELLHGVDSRLHDLLRLGQDLLPEHRRLAVLRDGWEIGMLRKQEVREQPVLLQRIVVDLLQHGPELPEWALPGLWKLSVGRRCLLSVEALHRPLSIDAVRDGGVYTLTFDPLPQTNLFLKVGCVDEVFVKQPSKRGFEDYRRYVKLAESSLADIRPLENAERFEKLGATLAQFPDFARLDAVVNQEIVHYLAVHKLQYERLRVDEVIGIPTARFGVLRSGRWLRRFEPVFFQQRVEGTTLWEMFDFRALEVRSRWWPSLPTIAAQLSGLVGSSLLPHIDWNIQNFVFRERDQRLFYVDLKPTTFVARQGNEHNLNGIREYFFA